MSSHHTPESRRGGSLGQVTKSLPSPDQKGSTGLGTEAPPTGAKGPCPLWLLLQS